MSTNCVKAADTHTKAMKLVDLKARCKQLGITGYSKLSKDQLIAKLDSVVVKETPSSSSTPASQNGAQLTSRTSDPAQVTSVSLLSSTESISPCDAALFIPLVNQGIKLSSGSPSMDQNGDHAMRPTDRNPQCPVPIDHANVATPQPTGHTKNDPTTRSLSPLSVDATVSRKGAADRRLVGHAAIKPIVKQAMPVSRKPVRHRFKPLVQRSQSTMAQTAPRSADEAASPANMSTAHDQVIYINRHFLETMTRNLNANRRQPILKSAIPKADALRGQNVLSRNLAFQGIAPKIYGKGEDAFVVAVRFVIFRLHSCLQLGLSSACDGDSELFLGVGNDITRWPLVKDIEMVTRDIWLVTTDSSAVRGRVTSDHSRTCPGSKRKHPDSGDDPDILQSRYLVLAVNGEPIGLSESSAMRDPDPIVTTPTVHGCRLRADWRAMLAGPKFCETLDFARLLRTKESRDYPAGVSKAWLARLADRMKCQADELGDIARRCALTSCVLNRLAQRQTHRQDTERTLTTHISSGIKFTAAAMDLAWIGQPNAIPQQRVPSSSKLEFYLPETHRVESVHLPPAPWHPQLVMVHRASGHTDFALHETGQVVGDLDSGVTPLWQGILGCNEKGDKEEDASAKFWLDWESRL